MPVEMDRPVMSVRPRQHRVMKAVIRNAFMFDTAKVVDAFPSEPVNPFRIMVTSDKMFMSVELSEDGFCVSLVVKREVT